MRINQVRLAFLQGRQPLLLLVLQSSLQAKFQKVLDLCNAISLFRLDLFPEGHDFITPLLKGLISLVQSFHLGLELCLPLLEDRFRNLFTMACMASLFIKEAFGTDSHLAVIAIVNFFEASVLPTQVFPLKDRSRNHLLELAHSYKFAAALPAFSAASRASKLAQAGRTDDTGALWAYFDDPVFRRDGKPTDEAFYQAAFIVVKVAVESITFIFRMVLRSCLFFGIDHTISHKFHKYYSKIRL